jgi:hypothetical protein
MLRTPETSTTLSPGFYLEATVVSLAPNDGKRVRRVDSGVWHYLISGLSISSEIRLPGAISRAATGECEVAVRRGAIPSEFVGEAAQRRYRVMGSVFFYDVPGLARYLVSHGKGILVDILDGSKESDAALFVLTMFGVLLHQRGDLILHGSAIAIDGAAMIFCGPSGVGKSTLAASLMNRGHRVVSDDLSRIGFDANGRPVVFPDGRMLKLWTDSLEYLSLSDSRDEAVRSGVPKFFVHMDELNPNEALQVGAIYILGEAAESSGTRVIKPDLIRSVALVRDNAYSTPLLGEMNMEERYFRNTVRLLNHVDVFCLVRPFTFSATEVALDALRAHWIEAGLAPNGEVRRV